MSASGKRMIWLVWSPLVLICWLNGGLCVNVNVNEHSTIFVCNQTCANSTLIPPLRVNLVEQTGGECNASMVSDCELSVACGGVGKTNIELIDQNNETCDLTVISLFRTSRWETVFIVGVAVLLFIALFTMGCKLDLNNIYSHVKHPTNVLIGIFCQFVFMPLVSFGLAMAATAGSPEDSFFQLGIFACGIAPGGGASNIYTEIFEGNIDLSVLMTLTSTVAAFATVPFWLATLGRSLSTEYAFSIPLKRIATSLATLLAPLAIGMLVRYCAPRAATTIAKTIKFFSLAFLIFVIVIGFVAYSYIFVNLRWKVVVVSICLPWIGFTAGWLISYLMKRPLRDLVAICLETGIQNTGIAIYILTQALEQPFASLSLICPIFVALATPVPIITCLSIRMIIERIRNNKKKNLELDADHSTYHPAEIIVE